MWVALFLLGCTSKADDDVSACECVTAEVATFAGTATGGYDDWSGTAVGWGVDEAAGRAIVVAMAFELPAATIDGSPDCELADEMARRWTVAVPESAADAASRYPLLGSILTDSVGVRSLPASGALLAEGDLSSEVPERLYVATAGSVTLTRGEESDRIAGALDFAATTPVPGGRATEDCDASITISRIDLSFAGTGSE
jgi:hypothetical protein